MMRFYLMTLCLIWVAATAVSAEGELTNPFGSARETVSRLWLEGEITLDQDLRVAGPDGALVPHQVEAFAGQHSLVVRAVLPANQTTRFSVVSGSASFDPLVRIREQEQHYELDNGRISIRVPRSWDGKTAPGPIAGLKAGAGPWLGASRWNAPPLQDFSVEVVGDGTVRARVVLHYDFGQHGSALVDVRLAPNHDHVEIREDCRLPRLQGHAWTLVADGDWQPDSVAWTTLGSGAGQRHDDQIFRGALEPNLTRLSPTVVNLQPRWTQAFDEGWFFAVGDGQHLLAGVPIRASKWRMPHEHLIAGYADVDGAGWRCPVADGGRAWMLHVGTGDLLQMPTLKSYVQRHAMRDLDKLNAEYILTWEDATPRFAGTFYFDHGNLNPTGHWRQIGKRALKSADRVVEPDVARLVQVQSWLDADCFGRMWDGWSPENPNFFTDHIKRIVGEAATLRNHPRWPELRERIVMKVREDLWHAVALPGGAGQECPGYLQHALHQWERMAPVLRKHYNFDITADDRFRAARDFLQRISQPYPDGRRALPMGDTHPGGDGPRRVEATADGWQSEVFPGFGAILRAHAGTAHETYVAFKAGPNRGHYHGDQLAFHFNAQSRPVAVDHHASYKPRPGQEHMHNRVSFATEQFPFANMDGHERLLAFATSPQADVAIAEVTSPRLRSVRPLPPEAWDTDTPAVWFDEPMRYERRLALLKAFHPPVLVVFDAYAGPEVSATYNLHVRSASAELSDDEARFDNLIVTRLSAQPVTTAAFDWSHDNGGTETTKGLRWTYQPDEVFVTLLDPDVSRRLDARWSDGELRLGNLVVRSDDNGLRVTADGRTVTDAAISTDLSQGEIGLFVPDAGYPFGPLPGWLVTQRSPWPAWYQDFRRQRQSAVPFRSGDALDRWLPSR